MSLPTEPSPRRMRLLSGLVLAAIFGAGVLTGMGLPLARAAALSPKPEEGPVFPYKELGLSPEQEARVRGVLLSHKPRMDALLGEVLPRVQALSEQIEAEVLRELTPEQRERFRVFKAGRPAPTLPGMHPPQQ